MDPTVNIPRNIASKEYAVTLEEIEAHPMTLCCHYLPANPAILAVMIKNGLGSRDYFRMIAALDGSITYQWMYRN